MGNKSSKFFKERRHAQELNCTKQELKVLPKDIAMCTRLQVLQLQENQLSDLPDEISVSYSMQILVRNDCDLVVAHCTALRLLNLSNNAFNHFPACICSLPGLQELLFSNNRLFYAPIPPALGQMSTLARLDLSNNQLE